MEWVEKVWKHPVYALRLLRMATDELADYAKGRLIELIERYDPNREHWKLVCSYASDICGKLNSVAERTKKIYWSCVDDYGLDYYCARSAKWDELERELQKVASEALEIVASLLDEIAEALDALCPDLDRADSP